MPIAVHSSYLSTDDEYDFVIRCDNPVAYWKLGDKTGTTASLYIDGVLDVSPTITRSTRTTTSTLTIGANNSAGGPIQHFPGTIDEISVFNHALTPTEIQNLYNAGKDCFRLV